MKDRSWIDDAIRDGDSQSVARATCGGKSLEDPGLDGAPESERGCPAAPKAFAKLILEVARFEGGIGTEGLHVIGANLLLACRG